MASDRMLPWIVPERCEGCADCVSACDSGCLSMHETAREGVFIPWLDKVDACAGCGKCELACTWAAIAMTSYVEEARTRFAEKHPGSVQAGARIA